jgi:hypothetical protein
MQQPPAPDAVVTKGEKGFQPGHSRFGGKRRNITHAVRAMAEEMGVDPVRFMLRLIKNDTYMETQIVDGKKKKVEVVVPLEVRADLAKYVARFCYPVLTASQITGADEGPVEVAAFSITDLMLNPAACEAAQKLALAMAETKQLPAAATEGPSAPHDVTLDKDSSCHWR